MSAPYRDAQTEQAIADAREPVMIPIDEGPFDDKPMLTDEDPVPPRTVLTGESHDAFAEFTAAAQALEAHQRAATPVLERYKVALGKLSAIAARSAP